MTKKFDVTGNDLKTLRKRIGMAQSAVAHKIGVQRQTLGNWENDIGSPPSTTIFKMLKLFGLKNLAPLLEEIERIVKEEGKDKEDK